MCRWDETVEDGNTVEGTCGGQAIELEQLEFSSTCGKPCCVSEKSIGERPGNVWKLTILLEKCIGDIQWKTPSRKFNLSILNMPWIDRVSVAMQVCQSVLVLFVSLLCTQSYLFTSGKFWTRCDFTTIFGCIEIRCLILSFCIWWWPGLFVGRDIGLQPFYVRIFQSSIKDLSSLFRIRSQGVVKSEIYFRRHSMRWYMDIYIYISTIYIMYNIYTIKPY